MDWLQYTGQLFKEAFSNAIGVADGILFVFTIIAYFWRKSIPKRARTKMKELAWRTSLVAFIVLSIVGLVLASYNLYKEQEAKIVDLEERSKQVYAIPDELMASHLKGLSIRIADMAREDLVIRNRWFEDCHIYGPATLIILDGTEIAHCTFKAPSVDEMFVVIQEDRLIMGAIGLENCIFRRCEFHKIGFIGHEEMREMFESSTIRK